MARRTPPAGPGYHCGVVRGVSPGLGGREIHICARQCIAKDSPPITAVPGPAHTRLSASGRPRLAGRPITVRGWSPESVGLGFQPGDRKYDLALPAQVPLGTGLSQCSQSVRHGARPVSHGPTVTGKAEVPADGPAVGLAGRARRAKGRARWEVAAEAGDPHRPTIPVAQATGSPSAQLEVLSVSALLPRPGCGHRGRSRASAWQWAPARIGPRAQAGRQRPSSS